VRQRLLMALACALVVAAVSVPLVSALNYDAWGWLMWGREIAGDLPFSTAGYPSWKPLTGLLAVPLAPLGDAAPAVWLLTVRSAAAIAVLLAFRLGRRAGGPWAGVLAAAALLLIPGWLFQAGVGGSEPILTMLLLGSLDRYLAGDHRAGLLLAFLAALLRPESWPALALAGVVAWRRRPSLRPWVFMALAVVPLLWFGGDYLGSGSPFTGGHMARISKQAKAIQHAGSYPPLVVAERALHMVSPLFLLGLPVALVAGLRRRDPLLLTLCLGALVWTAEVAVMAAVGYAGIGRFLFPAAAAAVVAGAAGLLILVRLPHRVGLQGVLAMLVLALFVGFGAGSASGTARDIGRVEQRADLDQSLSGIMARVSPRRFSSAQHVSAQGVEATALAWRLGVMAESLRHARVPGVALTLREQPWQRLSRRVSRQHLVIRRLARDQELSLVSVSRPGLCARRERARPRPGAPPPPSRGCRGS
jgi:hypothetical protein